MSFFRSKNMSDTFDLIKYVSSDMTYETKYLISEKSYTEAELNNMLDSYGNNLLHLAVSNGNYEMVDYLLSRGLDQTRQNKFKYSPWNMAVMFRNEKVLETLIKYKRSDCSDKIAKLEMHNKELKKANEELSVKLTTIKYSISSIDAKLLTANLSVSKLNGENAKLEHKLTNITQESTIISQENHRLRNENKRLRDDNNELIERNKKLKISVETLMANNRK